MTRGKIRHWLGYDLAEKYRYRHSKEFYPEHGERRSGRTVDMMITVMEALLRGERVIIVAHNVDYANQLEMTARHHARTLHLDPAKIRAFGIRFEHNYRYQAGYVVYDHWCYEPTTTSANPRFHDRPRSNAVPVSQWSLWRMRELGSDRHP